MIELLTCAAYGALCLGTYFIPTRTSLGWALRIVGDAAWIPLGLAVGVYSIALWAAVFAVLDLRGLLRARHDSRVRRAAWAAAKDNYKLGRGVVATFPFKEGA